MFSNCSTSWRLTHRAFRPIPFSYPFPHPHKLSICPPVHFRRYIHSHAHLHRLRTALSQRSKFANLSTFPTKLNQHVFRRRARILNTLAGANHAKQVPELRVCKIYCSKYYSLLMYVLFFFSHCRLGSLRYGHASSTTRRRSWM